MRRPGLRDRLADLLRSRAAGAAVAQQPVQPDRPGAARRAPPQGGRVVPRGRHAAGVRRVLPRVRVGGREPVSVLHPDVCGGSYDGVLAVHSLSKRSNLAGYRCGFVAGDPAVLGRAARGPQEPRPDAARPAAAGDGRGAGRRRPRGGPARDVRRAAGGAPAALRGAGFRVDHSEASLYLWATRDEDCWDTVAWFAERGVLVAPGSFYGARGHATYGSRSPRPTNGSRPRPARLG